ncbi:hypothetical protein D6764_04610 [Candidatus Woesearchaeota archaeon]|nr:MAG: hypothetical protein D6764_04610 [Candidatus Woesearchaeota archaeon]
MSSSSRRSKFLGFVVKVGEFFFNLTLLEAMITLVVLFALIGHLDWLILFYAVWLPVRLVVVVFLYSRSVALLDRDAE